MKIDLLSNDLFGNEAGEDENPHYLQSYFIEKIEFNKFYSSSNKFMIVMSRKGMGKSALLKRTSLHLEQDPDVIINSYFKGCDIVALQEVTNMSPNNLIYIWQQRICNAINLELCTKIKIGIEDDSIYLVEKAEFAGFKGKNIIGMLLNRMKIKIGNFQFENSKEISKNSMKLLSRYQEKQSQKVWLFIDDIDATFINTNEERLLLATFFSACRNAVNFVEGLHIRVSVRTDVWSLIKQFDESLDKCEQYIINLSWTEKEYEPMINKKILSYFRRAYPENELYQQYDIKDNSTDIEKLVFKEVFRIPYRAIEKLSKDGVPDDILEKLKKMKDKYFPLMWKLEESINNILGVENARFKEPILQHVSSNPRFNWCGRPWPPHKVIYILSNKRPRWASQLCKLAASEAANRGVSGIMEKDLDKATKEFSNSRIDYLYKEHRHQYEKINDLIQVFVRSKLSMSTYSLLDLIDRKLIHQYGFPVIDGRQVNETFEVAHFLYRIGFISAIDINELNKSIVHIYHEDNPTLLTSKVNLDNGFSWSIHPCYRSALKIE